MSGPNTVRHSSPTGTPQSRHPTVRASARTRVAVQSLGMAVVAFVYEIVAEVDQVGALALRAVGAKLTTLPQFVVVSLLNCDPVALLGVAAGAARTLGAVRMRFAEGGGQFGSVALVTVTTYVTTSGSCRSRGSCSRRGVRRGVNPYPTVNP